MTKKTRRWDLDREEDPLSGLVNLFDLWIVVVIALILVLAKSAQQVPSMQSRVDDPFAATKDSLPIETFRATDSELTGKGTRLGTAYRLESGEIVYTPD
ncbi:hypothetical protein VN12_12570 [Pirellula sp. SH-Sr6A]|uniref:DUF2149 domain-containing protein n=1 Tax=Pirellula sp. SH-Sr6A TaxID=1632865 RepID=UPI00078B2176|nr:DUF2149 domain-containing protein [Pirellula sp. SH-Sr6A]AMV32954.1 hypothetical protein VN12_12570 [Pirellula sp. SH-Sr6A]